MDIIWFRFFLAMPFRNVRPIWEFQLSRPVFNCKQYFMQVRGGFAIARARFKGAENLRRARVSRNLLRVRSSQFLRTQLHFLQKSLQ
jgi:hypothetical protein